MPNREQANMPRRRKPTSSNDTKRQQFNVAFPPKMAARIDKVAEALGIDATNLIRMMIHESIAAYEERARKARGEEASSAPPTA